MLKLLLLSKSLLNRWVHRSLYFFSEVLCLELYDCGCCWGLWRCGSWRRNQLHLYLTQGFPQSLNRSHALGNIIVSVLKILGVIANNCVQSVILLLKFPQRPLPLTDHLLGPFNKQIFFFFKFYPALLLFLDLVDKLWSVSGFGCLAATMDRSWSDSELHWYSYP